MRFSRYHTTLEEKARWEERSQPESPEKMETSNLFFHMRMIYNHFALIYGMPTVLGPKEEESRGVRIRPRLMEEIQADPQMYATSIALMMAELNKRKDLSKGLQKQFAKIRNTIKFARDIARI